MLSIKKLTQDLQTGRISRREFVKTAALVGLATTLPGITSCGKSSEKGGKLTVGLLHGSTTDSLDPGTYLDTCMQSASFARNNYLTEIDNHNNLIGELAESWDVTPDAKRWTFHIRQGVEFHNGKTLTTRDVIDSINHHRGAKSTSAAKQVVASIVEIKANGNDVIITLQEGNADFPFALSDYHLPILSSQNGQIDWASGVGTGAYMLTAFDPGVRYRCVRNPNYWKPNRAHFDEVEVLTIADVTARTNALTTGKIDFMDNCDIKTLHLLERNKDIRIEETQGTGHYTIPMRTNLKPFDNNNVRLALKYALDREAILSTILRGHGYVGNDHPIGKGQRYFADDLPQKSYDPDKAKFYLKKAGLSSLKVDMKASDAAFGGAVDAAVLYKEHAAPIGIDINVVRVPKDGYWENVWNTDNCNWCMCYWAGRPAEDLMFTAAYAETAPWNDTKWQHQKFNQLLVAARSELDEAKRREMYGEMQRLVSDEGGVVVPVFNNYIHAVSTKIGHEKEMASNLANDGLRFAERWWFV